jgi:hypothetical protein
VNYEEIFLSVSMKLDPKERYGDGKANVSRQKYMPNKDSKATRQNHVTGSKE